jgi:hypothetical protein
MSFSLIDDKKRNVCFLKIVTDLTNGRKEKERIQFVDLLSADKMCYLATFSFGEVMYVALFS